MIQLYNSFSEKKEKLDLSKKIGIYVCGITPYDTTHLGHAFTFTIYDALIRYLRFQSAKVTYVQNVTDIDDDILIRARSLKTSWQRLGIFETQKHLKNMDTLGALRPDYFPKATENINEMISIIKTLITKKLAYIKNGCVYFSIARDKNFGKLSRLGYRAMLEIANDRGNFPLDPNKNDPLDFVLWQKSKSREPSWNSPWSKGRPGWHVECSTMSMKYLGPTITIHGGGTDLIFPHHEAEIAQSENATGKKFVRIWMHTAMVYCEGKKMSKSLGNMVFVSDLLKKYSPNIIRILLLSHNYRTPWNFEEEELTDAQKSTEIIEKSVKKGSISNKKVKKSIPNFFDALDDDFNSPQAIKSLIKYTKSKSVNPRVVYKCTQILGLKLS